MDFYDKIATGPPNQWFEFDFDSIEHARMTQQRILQAMKYRNAVVETKRNGRLLRVRLLERDDT